MIRQKPRAVRIITIKQAHKVANLSDNHYIYLIIDKYIWSFQYFNVGSETFIIQLARPDVEDRD